MIIDRRAFGSRQPAPQVARDDRVLKLGIAHMALEGTVRDLAGEVEKLKQAVAVLYQQIVAMDAGEASPPQPIDLNEPPVVEFPVLEDEEDDQD